MSQNSNDTSNKNNLNELHFTKAQADHIKNKYPGRLPVLIWETGTIEIKRRKFIVPKSITLGQFLYVLRKQLVNFNSADGLFLFVSEQNILLPAGDTVEKIYNMYNKDGFLRFDLMRENTFG